MAEDIKTFINGRIFTSNPKQPYASAMVVEEGKITWIGDEKDLKIINGNPIDLKGRRVLPGFIDGHMHALHLANASKQVPCTPPVVNSIGDLQEQISKRRTTITEGEWLEGWGFYEENLSEGRFPNRWDLDKASPDRPVVLTRTCGHIISVNSAALKKAGINRFTPDPPGGEIVRDSNGEPTGILKESAREIVYKNMPPQDIEVASDALVELGTYLLSYGITAVSDCLAKREPIDYINIYRRANEKGFKQKTLLYYTIDELIKEPGILPQHISKEQQTYIAGVKLIGDGSMTGKTAWVDPPFLGEKDNYGISTASYEDIKSSINFARKHDIQFVHHALGNKAIEFLLDIVKDETGWLDSTPSIRIEHAGIMSEGLIKKAAAMGIPVVTQPIFIFAEVDSYLKSVGYERTKDLYPVKSMLEGEVKVAFSSDAPATPWAEPANPFVGIKSAVTRVAYDGTDTGQNQRVDVATAIMLYTREAQQITGVPKIGQLAPGYYADFMVLNKDILEVSPEKIDEINVEETYVKGELVYKS